MTQKDSADQTQEVSFPASHQTCQTTPFSAGTTW